MMNENALLFLVYSFLRKKFEEKPQEEQDMNLDDIADKAAWKRDKEAKAKEEYIRAMMQKHEEFFAKPKAIPLPPVMD